MMLFHLRSSMSIVNHATWPTLLDVVDLGYFEYFSPIKYARFI